MTGGMATRRFEFEPTPSVESARRRGRFIPCPACGSQQQRYLFHRKGVRFVRCRACNLVYADPVDPTERAYFDVEAVGQHADELDHAHALRDFGDLLGAVADRVEHLTGRRPGRVLLVGRWLRGFEDEARARGIDLTLAVDVVPDETALVTGPLAGLVGDLEPFDVVLLHELLEAAPEPTEVLRGLAGALAPDAVVAVSFANMNSVASRVLRRRWRSFFDRKSAFYDEDNLEIVMWRNGFERVAHARLGTTYSARYLAARLQLSEPVRGGLERSRLGRVSARVSSGYEVTLFRPAAADARECLSIIVPVFNEERYVGEVIDALLEKELPVDKEVIIVESNSDDSSREIVSKYADAPGVTLLLQDRPRGKGNAVRAGLDVARGTIVLIQDADFEYDLDDYDALLEPIVQRRASFVLGSRSLGLDDWKVRQYARSPIKGFLMNFAQVAFAKTFNVLYQQRVTDINTMLKVFRRECVDGVHFEGNGFNFDIELVCKIVRNGFEPHEVPVNYVARSFDEGKKINFLLDAYPSYWQLFRCRVGRL